jgi:zinc and cadmium transporter
LPRGRSIQTSSQESSFVTLAMIVAATVLSGALSVLVAAALSLTLLKKVVRQMVSLSAGLLLATAVLHLLPEAFESDLDPHSLAWSLLAGLVAFFLLEKMAVLRHSHHFEGDGHGHHHGHDRAEAGPGGSLILLGDAIHNFSDGVLIAAAFMIDHKLGWLTTIAIAAHEVPQEIGDFMVLLNAGYTRMRALVFNALSGLSAVLGGLLGYFALAQTRELLPFVLMIAAASFIYVALADLVPDLHRHSRHRGEWVVQFALMMVGVAIVAVTTQHLHVH